ncbi:YeiH family protein [Spirosoma montaniterrae]|uniref:Sulfate exporter family transporter n=1 Tax=Spirosoma montaniterrae TaxID=1178516 RepID=A0A1P9WX01_9BACT|nr:putative sulfate exporter family transporter [Spirosoma montaniterrae]AQG79915.1 hypothetical protein AWR27_11615 [Spirosoma montaniterrae]
MNGKKALYVFTAVVCFLPVITSSGSLLLGLAFALIVGNPFKEQAGRWGGYLLKASVIGLGFGINMHVLIKAGQANIGTTTIFVLSVLALGLLLGRLLGIDRLTGLLVAVGTAICGGSAIAAVGSVMKANPSQLSMATGVVFLLNAVALFVFPAMGHALGLTQEQFGTWAAIAIHDTSSVVGASARYGDTALHVASITKMLRILWIIPVSLLLVVGFAENRESFKIPMFIVGFVLASCLYSFVPAIQPLAKPLYTAAKQTMVVSLFLIGSNLSLSSLKAVGGAVLLQAVLLWVVVSISALLFVMYV